MLSLREVDAIVTLQADHSSKLSDRVDSVGASLALGLMRAAERILTPPRPASMASCSRSASALKLLPGPLLRVRLPPWVRTCKAPRRAQASGFSSVSAATGPQPWISSPAYPPPR